MKREKAWVATANRSCEDPGQSRPRLGLVCSGGGAKGFLQLGFLDQISQAGFGPEAFDCLCGVSAGALTLYAFASRCDLSAIIELAKDKLTNRWLQWIPGGSLLHVWQLLRGRLKADLRRYLPSHPLETISPHLRIVSFDVVNGRPFVHTHGDPVEAIAASTAVPLFGRPVRYGRQLLIDGGAWCNLPVWPIRDLADVVIAVDLSSARIGSPGNGRISLPGIALRTWKSHKARVEMAERNRCDLLLSPDVSGFRFYDLTTATIDRLISLGRQLADEALPQIKSTVHNIRQWSTREPQAYPSSFLGFGRQFRTAERATRFCDRHTCAQRIETRFQGVTSCTFCP